MKRVLIYVVIATTILSIAMYFFYLGSNYGYKLGSATSATTIHKQTSLSDASTNLIMMRYLIDEGEKYTLKKSEEDFIYALSHYLYMKETFEIAKKNDLFINIDTKKFSTFLIDEEPKVKLIQDYIQKHYTEEEIENIQELKMFLKITY